MRRRHGGQPSAPAGSTAPGRPGMPAAARDAVQQALGAEHAAVWIYGLVSAFLPAELDGRVSAGMTAHRDRRDATERRLAAAGITPRPAEPAYLPPKPVDGRGSAITLLVVAESDAAVAWRAVLERTEDPDLREFALDALTSAAVLATRWRQAGGRTPAAEAMPGVP